MFIKQRGQTFWLRVTHKLLPGGVAHFTLPTFEEAQSYGTKLEASLAKGVVPIELLQRPGRHPGDAAAHKLLEDYLAHNPTISATDRDLVPLVKNHVPLATRISDVSFTWVDDFARRLRVEANLAPSTLRARVGCFSRAWVWYHQQRNLSVANPFEMLPAGYSIARGAEAKAIKAAGGKVKRDIKRDRRITPEEDAAILNVLAGVKPENRQRSLGDPELYMLYLIYSFLGLRMREGYWLRRKQVDLAAGILHVDGTKGHHGTPRPRDVPLRARVKAALREYMKTLPEGEWRLFPGLWDGSLEEEDLKRTTGRVGARFGNVFAAAGVEQLVEHDLRHEAACRWFLLRRPDGAFVYGPGEITKIMGWSSLAMAARYLSLQGDSLAEKLGDL